MELYVLMAMKLRYKDLMQGMWMKNHRIDETANLLKCRKCHNNKPNVVLRPCNHHIVCKNCARQMKHCIQCKNTIDDMITLEE